MANNKSPLIGLPVFIVLALFIGLACVNTRYSRHGEHQITDDLGYLIIGAFMHHGPDFYQKEVDINNALLDIEPHHFQALNDKGVALTKLGKFEEAEKIFLLNESVNPKRYETASNLGVLYKKSKQFAKASEYIRLALTIKPEGHMGLGDYYLKMIDFLQVKQIVEDFNEQLVYRSELKSLRASHQTKNSKNNQEIQLLQEKIDFAEKQLHDFKEQLIKLNTAQDFTQIKITENSRPLVITHHFLGFPYQDSVLKHMDKINRNYLISLIKNDFAFADSYLLLGDYLLEEKNYELAYRSFNRYFSLVPDDFRVNQAARTRCMEQIKRIFKETEKATLKDEVHNIFASDKLLEKEIMDAADWLKTFQKVEAERVKQDLPNDFKSLKTALISHGISKPKLLKAINFKGKMNDNSSTDTKNQPLLIYSLFSIATLLIVISLLFTNKKLLTSKKESRVNRKNMSRRRTSHNKNITAKSLHKQ